MQIYADLCKSGDGFRISMVDILWNDTKLVANMPVNTGPRTPLVPIHWNLPSGSPTPETGSHGHRSRCFTPQRMVTGSRSRVNYQQCILYQKLVMAVFDNAEDDRHDFGHFWNF
jgi:hypothetical protein